MRFKLVTVPLFFLLIFSILVTPTIASTTSTEDNSETIVLAPSELPFNDIKGHWAEAAIVEMYAKGVTRGYSDYTYRPKAPVTNLEAVVMIVKMLGFKPNDSDLEAGSYLGENFNIPQWAVGYVSIALKREIILYDELQNVALNRPLVRQDAAVFAVRSLSLAKQVNKNNLETIFKDISQAEEKTRGYIFLARERRVMNGFTDGTFRPLNPVSRAEMTIILNNTAQQLPYLRNDETAGYIKKIDFDKKTVILENPAGEASTIIFPEKHLTYLDGKAASFNELAEGNFLRVLNNKVIISVAFAQTVRPDQGLQFNIEPVGLNQVPSEIKRWVETSKTYESYSLRVDQGYVYFLVTRGEKMTAGYTASIIKVSREDAEDGIAYKVWVKRSDPAKDALVNQVITYPYALTRGEFTEGTIRQITFVDEFDRILAVTKVL